ncbi:hypothetical protein JXL21_01860 [Candidatus Bathyarchaeota archaeon]|nr:hypothetical protein [Candidatus Bathyarchaeota archaeon]
MNAIDYSGLMTEARRDVEAAVEVWRRLINERLGDRIDYAALKGSSTKRWDSPVDYVPVVSDVDIHVGIKEGQPLVPQNREGFLHSIETTRLYEEMFKEARPGHIHVPRIQFAIMNEARGDWLPESPDEVKTLYGEVPLKPVESAESMRARDLKELTELAPLLGRLPEHVIERIDLEYYRVLRMLCYVVSPTPVRVLSQSLDPRHVWKLNRTHVLRLLEREGYTSIAEPYREYYITGWRAFTEGFRGNDTMRQLLTHAYTVLDESYKAVKDR